MNGEAITLKTSNTSFLQHFGELWANSACMILLLIFNLPADLQAQGASRPATLEPLLSQAEEYSSSTGSRYRLEFERLVPEKGPDPDEPNCMFQDRHGFMWFGTRYGLLKYDGYTVTAYLHDPENLKSLNDNWILLLLEDSSGMLWIGTNEGLNRLDPESDTIVRYRHEFGLPDSRQDYAIMGLCEASAGTLWLAGPAGLLKHEPRTGNFTLYNNLPGAPDSDGYNSVRAVEGKVIANQCSKSLRGNTASSSFQF